jgi:hypothetical protein
MESNLLLEASFVTNPFLAATGVYDGFFFTTNGVTEQTSGMLRRLTVGPRGTYSGVVLINGGSHAIGGSFDLSGQATNYIARADSQGAGLTVVTSLNWNESGADVTGTVSGTNDGVPWVADLLADLATNKMPTAEYTLLLAPDTNHAPPMASPGGDGYLLITNSATLVRITGALADGTVFNQTVPISQDGFVPIFANLYGNKGLLLGWINLNLTNISDASFVGLTWVHPARATGLYQNGFTNLLGANQLLLSLWTNPPGNMDLLTNLSMLGTINDTNGVNFAVTTTAAGKVTGTSVSGTINPKTGLLHVTIGTEPNKTTGYGAILLNATNGGGYFLTTTNAQAIELKP